MDRSLRRVTLLMALPMFFACDKGEATDRVAQAAIPVVANAATDVAKPDEERAEDPAPLAAAPEAFEYLKALEGKWVVQNGKPDAPQWEFEVTSRGSAIVERLLIGTEKEMTTVYYLDNDRLIGTHYCQMKNHYLCEASHK
jgi:hypothetical protein